MKDDEIEAIENIKRIWRCKECSDLFEEQENAIKHHQEEHQE